MKTLIDSNILIYAYNLDSPFQKRAEEIIEDVYQGEINAYVADINLIEFYSVITDGRKVERPLSPEDASNILGHILKSDKFKKIYTTNEIIDQLPEQLKEAQVKRYNIYDHILYLLIKGNNINSVITANEKDFKKFPFIKIVNPFADIIKCLRREGKRDSIIPYGHQWVDEADIEAVVQVLRSAWLTTGPKVSEFEEAFDEFTGAKYAVTVSSGTAALHAAMYAIGIKPGDEVIVPAMTFAATANCVVFQGGSPVFVDVDPESLLIDPDQVKAKITPRTKAVIAVDYTGHACDYDVLREIADRYGLVLVADACHALGATYKGRPVGSLADLNVFSFHPVKHITTGEGGMITTDNPEFAERMRVFRNHGITTDYRQREKQGSWFYEMVDLGYNYRLSDIQCALGLSQLKKLPSWLKRRQEIVQRYNAAFAEIPVVRPLKVRADVSHAYHLYVIRLNLEYLKVTRAEVFAALRAEGIGVNVHYIPVHLHPFYRERFGTKRGMCPVAEAAYERIISLPIFPGMTDTHVKDVVEAVRKVVGALASGKDRVSRGSKERWHIS